MGSTTIIIKSFADPVFKVVEFENTLIKVTPFRDQVIVVPGNGEEEPEGIYDFSYDETYE